MAMGRQMRSTRLRDDFGNVGPPYPLVVRVPSRMGGLARPLGGGAAGCGGLGGRRGRRAPSMVELCLKSVSAYVDSCLCW